MLYLYHIKIQPTIKLLNYKSNQITSNNKICHLISILYIKMVNCPLNKLKRLKRANINKSDRRINMNYKKTLKTEIKKAIDTATSLCYDKSVIAKLKSAHSEAEIEQIMYGARKNG